MAKPTPSQFLTPAEPQKVKDQILQVLKLSGAQQASHLAHRLNVSPMAIRQHLQGLSAKGWVTYEEERQPMGRPVKLWRLTDSAQALFPSNHDDLVVNLLHSAEQVFGPAGLDALIRHRAEKQIQAYRVNLEDSSDWRDRVTQIAVLRSQEGYMAEAIAQPDGSMLLVENHCSISTAAHSCSKLCKSELDVFSAVLGDTVTIHRVEHILEGDRRCAYHIAENA